MPTPFPHTTRAIAADRPRFLLWATAIGLLLLTAWSVWFFAAEVTIYKISNNAKFDQDSNAVQLSAQRPGKILAVQAGLGDALNAGDIVVQLDSEPLELQRDGESRMRDSLAAELQAIERERQSLNAQFEQDRQAQAEKLERLRQLHQLQASNQAIQADVTARYEQLVQKQQSAQVDFLRAKRDYQRMVMATLEAKGNVEAAESRLQSSEQEYRRSLAALDQRTNQVQQQLLQANTRLQQHSLAVEEQHLRAPIAGTLASLADLRPGQILAAGQVIGAIRADGKLKVSARYSPAEALGHIRPGQAARVKLQGFSWAQYGQLEARVARVASAVRDGEVIVELNITEKPPQGLPMLHDLPASVEIATAGRTPYQLLLHHAGQLLTQKQITGPPPGAGR